ncbi:MAG TPA: (d)CMP kinase [Bacteroidetes bacterium]|nr:(d)CMP kinase [Bacteroidota bacterium]
MGKNRPTEPAKIIVTIDGPAGSGKSSTAQRVSEKLNYLYLDTGAMYRAITLKVIRGGIPSSQPEAVVRLLAETKITLRENDHSLIIYLDGEDVSELIRSPRVDVEIGWVCQLPEVRDRMVALQREIGREGGIVAEGRDMGTVVFPDAECKFYMVAGVEERGRRRWLQMQKRGIDISLEEIIADIRRRDKIDSERELSPLRRADDAVEIDTGNMTLEQQTEFIVQTVQEYLHKQ